MIEDLLDPPGAKELDDILTSGPKALPSAGIRMVRNDLIAMIATKIVDPEWVDLVDGLQNENEP